MAQPDEATQLLRKILTMQVLIHTELRHINHVVQKHNPGAPVANDLKKQTLQNLDHYEREVMAALGLDRP